MWSSSSKSGTGGKNGGRNGLVAVAIDKDRGSQHAIKWAVDNLLSKGQTVILIHCVPCSSNKYTTNGLIGSGSADLQSLESHIRELFLTFHCFCTRKDIHCFDVVLEDPDIAKMIVEYVAHAAIENLVLGASHHGFLKRLKAMDIPTSISKASPDFCTVYTISRSKISSVRNASRMAPFTSPLLPQIQQMQKNNGTTVPSSPDPTPRHMSYARDRTSRKTNVNDVDLFRSPLTKERGYIPSALPDAMETDSDISFVSSSRPSTDIPIDPLSGVPLFDAADSWKNSRLSTSSASSYGSWTKGSEQSFDDAEAEMRRLKTELQKTMEMYSTACREALTAKQKAVELNHWRMDEERRLGAARMAEEAARLNAEQERAKYKAALEDAQAARRIAEIEARKRLAIERKARSGSNETGHVLTSLRYRRYNIEEIEEATKYFSESQKIGEGGYGPVYRSHLDHTPVTPDAAQGKIQFNQEVEVLSCLRHPNMVLLLGACPEYGCLVYEYMANGSLEDRLYRKGNTRPLSWQVRFRIAAEIATGLQFLHQTKPEPLVHRDLKPANILLDQNYVSKISDVGLARLVPPSVADDVTQLRLTSTAGTFCYIDPEYQQTGMLGVKSDVYSFGIVLLQILTAKPAMGLTHIIGRAVEKGTIAEVLDPHVPDWPLEEVLTMAKLALQCAELRRKDRPDLGKIVLPELNKLREFSQENMSHFLMEANYSSPRSASFTHEKMARSAPDADAPAYSYPQLVQSVPNVAFTYSRPSDYKSSASAPDHSLY